MTFVLYWRRWKAASNVHRRAYQNIYAAMFLLDIAQSRPTRKRHFTDLETDLPVDLFRQADGIVLFRSAFSQNRLPV
jgi:ferric-dicitrate binding protein FerR (iron transport regulator)